MNIVVYCYGINPFEIAEKPFLPEISKSIADKIVDNIIHNVMEKSIEKGMKIFSLSNNTTVFVQKHLHQYIINSTLNRNIIKIKIFFIINNKI